MASIDHSHGRKSFGADPAAYHAARPPYPPELFQWLQATCALEAGSACFEIGAGTGLATFPMLALPVRSVLAFEPDQSLASHLTAQGGRPAAPVEGGPPMHPPEQGLEVAVVPFERADLAPQAFDFGFAATSLHWLPRGKALRLAHDALRPGAWVCAFWQVFQDPDRPTAFDAATRPLFSGLEEGSRKRSPRRAFALDEAARLGDLRAAGFDTVERLLLRETRSLTGEEIVRLYATLSRVAGSPAELRNRLLTEARRIAREEFGDRAPIEVQVSAFAGRRP